MTQRRPFELGLHLGPLVVEDAQRVDLDAGAGGLVEVEGAQEVLQRGPVDRAALGAAEGVQQQGQPLETQLLVPVPRDGDRLGVDQRVVAADRLQVDLVELPVTPGLGPLVAEGGADGPDLRGKLAVVQAVLQHRPQHPGGELRAQGDRTAAPVLEGVHLLGHDVGRLADAARVELGVLEHRQLEVAVAGLGHRGGEGVDRPPERRRAGRRVFANALGRLEAHHSPRCRAGRPVLQIFQERILGALAADGRLGSVTGENHRFVGQRQRLGETAEHGLVVAAGQIGAADGVSEQQVAR